MSKLMGKRRGSTKPEEVEPPDKGAPKDLFGTYDWRTRNSFAGRRLSVSPGERRMSRRESLMQGAQDLASELDEGPVDKKKTPLLSTIAARYDALQEKIRGMDSDTKLRAEQALRERPDKLTMQQILQGHFAEDRYAHDRQMLDADVRFRKAEKAATSLSPDVLIEEMLSARQKKSGSQYLPDLDFMDWKVGQSRPSTATRGSTPLPDIRESLTSEQERDLRKLQRLTGRGLMKDALEVRTLFVVIFS